MPVLRKRLGELLMEMRVLSEQQVQQALQEQQKTGEKIGEVFVRRGMCRASDVLNALSAQHGLPAADLSGANPPHGFQTKIESTYAETQGVVVFNVEGSGPRRVYHVAISDPRNPTILQELEIKLGGKVKPHVALEGQLRDLIRRYYYGQEGFGYDFSFHEGVGFRRRSRKEQVGEISEHPDHPPAFAPPPAAGGPKPADRHPAATSFSDLGSAADRIVALESEVSRLRQMVQALLKVLAEKGQITPEEFRSALNR